MTDILPVVNKEELQKINNQKVIELEKIASDMPQVFLQTESIIFGSMYSRTIFIPAGTLITGAFSNIDNICIISGDITVTTNDGPQRFTGYHVIPAIRGAKRAGIAHADTYWTTLIHTNKTSVEEAEKDFTSEVEKLQTERIKSNTILLNKGDS